MKGKLTQQQREEIKQLHLEGVPIKELAKMYWVHYSTINRVIHNYKYGYYEVS